MFSSRTIEFAEGEVNSYDIDLVLPPFSVCERANGSPLRHRRGWMHGPVKLMTGSDE